MAADNRGPQLAAVVIVLLVLCVVSVGLRCYTMGLVLRRFHPEDWLAVLTLAVYIAYSTFGLLGVHYGLGAHVDDIPANDRPRALFFKWAGQVTYVIVAALVKLIVGFLLLRLCAGKRWQRIVLWTLVVVSSTYALFYIVVVVFQCLPVQYYWYRYDPTHPVAGTCNGSHLATIPTYISFVISVLSDWILALLPVSIVWNAKMDRHSKISVSCVLALGSIASMATIARIPYTKQLLSNADYLHNFTDLAIWSTVEIGLGLTASSLATLKPLFRRLKILVVTRSGSRYAGTLPYHRSRTFHSRTKSGQSNFLALRAGNKLQKPPPIGSPTVAYWADHDAKGYGQFDINELPLAAESRSVRTTITARPSMGEGSPLVPPPQSHGFSTRRTSIYFRVSHINPHDGIPGGMI